MESIARSWFDDSADAEFRDIGRDLTGKDAARESMLVETELHAARFLSLDRAERVPFRVAVSSGMHPHVLFDGTCLRDAAAGIRRKHRVRLWHSGLD
jgi:hypothetical protein